MKNRVYLILVLALLPVICSAQFSGVRVKVDADSKAAIETPKMSGKINGFRVCLFSDNGQTARGAAYAALTQLGEIAPGVIGNVEYDNPFFKVYAGYCLSRSEAVRLLGRLKTVFPRAIISTATFEITDIFTPVNDEIQPQEPL